MAIPAERVQAIRAELTKRLQQAAALAFELGELLLSREIYQISQRLEPPANPPPDPAYEHPDERAG